MDFYMGFFPMEKKWPICGIAPDLRPETKELRKASDVQPVPRAQNSDQSRALTRPRFFSGNLVA